MDCTFINAVVLTPQRTLEDCRVRVKDGVIDAVGRDIAIEGETIDAGGLYLSPGFIDLHCHGGGGADFMDNEPEAFFTILKTHARFGTCSMLATTVAGSFNDLQGTFSAYNKAKALISGSPGEFTGAQLLGLHLEGPYLSAAQKGAMDERYVRKPDLNEAKAILSLCRDIRRWTIAPELEGALELCRFLKERGILVSAGHTDAVGAQLAEAFENGFRLVTHLYSCTSGLKRINSFRYSGVIEAAHYIEDMDVELIADGCHIPYDLLNYTLRVKGADRIALVTDAMRAAGEENEGREYLLGGKVNGNRCIVEDGVAKLPDRSAFAGSCATADRLVRNMFKYGGASLTEAVRMMTLTPARIIGLSRKGMIAPGYDADLLLFDGDIRIDTVMTGGSLLFGKG